MEGAGSEPRADERTVLLYVHALAGGGAERVVALLASGLAQAGWRVTLAVDRQESANRDFLDTRVAIVDLGAAHLGSIMRLARLLRETRPEISLSAMAASNLKHTVAAVLAGRRHRAVLTYHAFAASEPQRISQAGYWTLPVLSRVAARTVAVSNALRGHLVGRWRTPPCRTVTLYNPVVVGPRTRPAGQDGPPLILSVGRLIPDKNMRAVVRAFAIIAPACNAHLLILGEGPERAVLEQDIAALGLTDRVRLAGYVADPWCLYRAAACFVTASRLESFSMVIAEALSFGLPVVSVDSPGPREVLADGRFGTLVPPDDEPALADAMLSALRAPGEAAPRLARASLFSIDAAVDAYQRLFADVLADGDRRWRWPHLVDAARLRVKRS